MCCSARSSLITRPPGVALNNTAIFGGTSGLVGWPNNCTHVRILYRSCACFQLSRTMLAPKRSGAQLHTVKPVEAVELARRLEAPINARFLEDDYCVPRGKTLGTAVVHSPPPHPSPPTSPTGPPQDHPATSTTSPPHQLGPSPLAHLTNWAHPPTSPTGPPPPHQLGHLLIQ